jgi:hypothetical protein
MPGLSICNLVLSDYNLFFSFSKSPLKWSILENLLSISSYIVSNFSVTVFISFEIFTSKLLIFSKSYCLYSSSTLSLAYVVSEFSTNPYLYSKSSFKSLTAPFEGKLVCLAILLLICSKREAIVFSRTATCYSSYYFVVSKLSINSLISLSF